MTDKQNFEAISNVVNSTTFNPEKVGKLLASDHRYLQHQTMNLVINFLKGMKENHTKCRFDDRNKWAVSVANELLNHFNQIKP